MFPPGFLFGTATSATQVEGHCPDTDWYAFAAEPGRVKNGDTPAVACDGWHRFRDDVALQARLGMNAHRVSIEWARVEPRAGCAPTRFLRAITLPYVGRLGLTWSWTVSMTLS